MIEYTEQTTGFKGDEIEFVAKVDGWNIKIYPIGSSFGLYILNFKLDSGRIAKSGFANLDDAKAFVEKHFAQNKGIAGADGYVPSNTSSSYEEGSAAQRRAMGLPPISQTETVTVVTVGEGSIEMIKTHEVPAQPEANVPAKVIEINNGFETVEKVVYDVGTMVEIRSDQHANGEAFKGWTGSAKVVDVDDRGNHSVYTQGHVVIVGSDMLRLVMTAAEAAEEFGKAEATVRQAINRKTIPARKSGKTWLILRSDAVQRWGK